ncbi:hypothetical protein KBZ10_05740 [Streptomyces sp. F63]|uniref:DUF5708 family protein n=1 Tax=Streptomyces sp. F63 TaxID=2824887 RepID=UPI001B362421|nr:DUF5708 family protein [Streptomyces sp. F63]MBQ0984033.1 hypothetical protein [Streptomyces sp. F63]
MASSTKNLAEGAVTFTVGLALWLFTGDVEIPVFTLTKVGVVLMAVGGALLLTGLFQSATRSRPLRHR